jgi:hypothetical protein
MNRETWLMILCTSAALGLVGAVAIALLFSIDVGRPSWILAAIICIDSLALLVIGVRGLKCGNDSSDSPVSTDDEAKPLR